MAERTQDAPLSVRWMTHPGFQAASAVLTLIAIVFFAIQYYVLHPYDGMSADYYSLRLRVEAVYGGGPAERAGIRVGDEILSVDGHSTKSPALGPVYGPGLAPGDTVTLQIRRGDEILGHSLTLGSYLDNPALLAVGLGVFLFALSIWGIGFVLCLFSPPHSVGPRLIGLCWLLGGMSVATSGPGGWSVFLTVATMYGGTAFMVELFAFAHLYFPVPRFTSRLRRRFIGVLTSVSLSVAVVMAVLQVAQPITEQWESKTLPMRYLAQAVGDAGYAIICGHSIVMFLVGAGLLVHARLTIHDPVTRRQVSIILWGTVLGGAAPVMVMFLDIFIQLSSLAYTYSMFSGLLVPLAYAYVIYQRKLVRVDFIINRAVVLFVLTLLAFVLPTAVLLGVAFGLGLPAETALLGGAAAATVALLAPGLRRGVQRRVDLVLYGCHYDFAMVTGAFSERLAQAVDRETLTGLLVDALVRQMGIRQAALLLEEEGRLVQQDVESEGQAATLEGDVAEALRAGGGPVRAEVVWERAGGGGEGLEWVQLLAPLVYEGGLCGVLLLGGRHHGDIYSAGDVSIIDAVAHQGALAYENVRLVERLHGLNRQLVRADEAQRKQVARDLHDVTLQQLFFVKQGLFREREKHGVQIDLLEETIQQLRGVIRELRPPLLDQGLVLALEGLVEGMGKVAGEGLEIVWESEARGRLGLGDEEATALYRIAQEAVTNAVKHAEAERITVTLGVEGERIRLSIADDGRGEVEEREGHYGLAGMRERAGMIGAVLDVGPAPGGGTCVTVEMAA